MSEPMASPEPKASVPGSTRTGPGRVLIASFAVRGASLDDVFLTLTQHDTAKETSGV